MSSAHSDISISDADISNLSIKDFPKAYAYTNPVNNFSIFIDEKEKIISHGDADDSEAQFCKPEDPFYCFSDFIDFAIPKDKSKLTHSWNYSSPYKFTFKDGFGDGRTLYALGEWIDTLRIESKQDNDVNIEFLYSYFNGLVAIIFHHDDKSAAYISTDICGFGAAEECKKLWLEKAKNRLKKEKARREKYPITADP